MSPRRWIIALALIGAALLTRWALRPAPPAGGGPKGPGVSPSRVIYEMAWALGDAKPLGAGFALDLPSGRVEVDELAVVDSSVALVSCSPPKPPTALIDWIIPTARAGHTLSPEAARRLGLVQVDTPHVSRFAPEAVELFGERILDGSDRYCRIHWLVARGPTHGPHDLTAEGWAGVSLRVRGRFVPPGQPPQPFGWETGMANGAFRDLPAELVDDAPTRLRLVRHVDKLFEGISFSDRAELLPRKVLNNLFLYTELLVLPP